ncbi:MAG: redoxin domain-containing protein [Cyanobacteria bacterium REEB65]|nr:redoxin domain-containing protein [Cyanobacteria bacterium REEB65]
MPPETPTGPTLSRKTSSYIALGVVGVAVVAIVAALFLAKPGPQAQANALGGGLAGANTPKIGQLAPDFDLPNSDGSGDVRLSSLRGQQVLLVFYRTHT